MSSIGKNTAKPLFVIELRQERAGDARSGQFRSKLLPIIDLRGKRRLARISRNPRKTCISQHIMHAKWTQFRVVEGGTSKRWPCWKLARRDARLTDLGFGIMPEAGTHAARNGIGGPGNWTAGVHQVPP